MKTCEQITADVLARRDAYLARREQKRRAAKKYAVASLLALAAFAAAAVLYRSGLLRAAPRFNILPPHSATAPAVSDTLPTERTEDGAGTSTPGTGTMEPGTGNAEVPRGTASAPLPHREDPVTVPQEEPAGTTAREETPTSLPPTEQAPSDRTTARQAQPTAVPTTVPSPVPTTQQVTPVGEPTTIAEKPTAADDLPQTAAPTTDKNSATAESPALSPTEVSATETPTAAPPQGSGGNCIYVAYQGSLYMAENVPVVAIPDGAETLEGKDAYLYEDTLLLDADMKQMLQPDRERPSVSPGQLLNNNGLSVFQQAQAEASTAQAQEEAGPTPTRITLVSIPGAPTDVRIGMNVEGIEGMFVLERFARIEDLTQEEIP